MRRLCHVQAHVMYRSATAAGRSAPGEPRGQQRRLAHEAADERGVAPGRRGAQQRRARERRQRGAACQVPARMAPGWQPALSPAPVIGCCCLCFSYLQHLGSGAPPAGWAAIASGPQSTWQKHTDSTIQRRHVLHSRSGAAAHKRARTAARPGRRTSAPRARAAAAGCAQARPGRPRGSPACRPPWRPAAGRWRPAREGRP